MHALIFLTMIVVFPGSIINKINGIDPMDTLKKPAIVQQYKFND